MDTGVIGDGLSVLGCTDHVGAVGKTYTLVAVADVNADDLGACGAGALQSDACLSALADTTLTMPTTCQSAMPPGFKAHKVWSSRCVPR